MFGIGSFFSKIRDAQAREVFVRSVVQQAVLNHTSVTIPLDSISFSATNLVLKGINHMARSVIFIKKNNIIRDINKGQTIKLVTDIR